MKKIFLLLLVLSLLMGTAGCGEKTPAEIPDTSAQPAVPGTTESVVAESEPAETVVRDDLGEYDFDGADFHMYTRFTQMFYPNLNVEEDTGDLMDHAVYERNRMLEERFDFSFKETAYYNTVEGNDAPRKLLASGDDTYHIITGRYLNMFHYAAEGYLQQTTKLPNIDLAKPYWNQAMYETLSISGKHFFAVGDFNISAFDFTHAIVFNKQMAVDYNMGDLYETVRSGKWTFDMFHTLSEQAIDDLDGDGVMTDKDQYGYTSIPAAVMPGFWIGADVQPATKDADEAVKFTAVENEKFFEVCAAVFAMTRDNGAWYESLNGAAGDNQPAELFRKNGALFMDARMYSVIALRDSDVEFGILPYPKYTEDQVNYRSRVEGCELFGVPPTNTALEMTGTILEAMACESRISVIPTYYETMLQYKVSRDAESGEMLDLIFSNLVFDYADTLLGTDFRDGIMNQCFHTNNQNLTSILKKGVNAYNKTLDTFNNAFAALED